MTDFWNPTNFPNAISTTGISIGGFVAAGDVGWTVGVEAADVINVAGQLEDGLDNNVEAINVLDWYLADDATGATPSTVAPSGGVAIGTNGKLIENNADLNGRVVTDADGQFDVDITEAGAKTYYLVLVRSDGKPMVSDPATFA